MSASGDVRKFGLKVQGQAKAVVDIAAALTFQSIVEGSQITGAPGQPVQSGNLRGSWQLIPVAPWIWEIVTNVIYAPQIEDGTREGRALTLRSPVGGFHSVKLTVLGWPKIVEEAQRRAAA